MALATDIEECGARAMAALDLSHDYYAHSVLVWRSLGVEAKAGRQFSLRNLTTGSAIDPSNLQSKSQMYIDYLAGSTFQQFISLFEEFLFDLMTRWLMAFPGSLSGKTLKLESVLRARGTDDIVRGVVEAELNELKYKRIADWFKYFEGLVRLGCPSADEVDRLAEIKASRDILAHNRGITNQTYVSKAGASARYPSGAVLEIPEPYHLASWQLIRKVIADITAAAKAKA